jgi:hypothetical protein
MHAYVLTQVLFSSRANVLEDGDRLDCGGLAFPRLRTPNLQEEGIHVVQVSGERFCLV